MSIYYLTSEDIVCKYFLRFSFFSDCIEFKNFRIFCRNLSRFNKSNFFSHLLEKRTLKRCRFFTFRKNLHLLALLYSIIFYFSEGFLTINSTASFSTSNSTFECSPPNSPSSVQEISPSDSITALSVLSE